MHCNARFELAFWLARNSVVTFVAYGVMLVIQHGFPKELALNPTAGVMGAAGDDFLYTV